MVRALAFAHQIMVRAERFNGEGRVLREPCIEKLAEILDERPTMLLTCSTTLFGRLAANIGLDRIEAGDAREHVGCHGRCAGGGKFVEATSHVRPTEGELDLATPRERRVAAIAIDLQNAFEPGEMLDRPIGLAIGRVAIGDRWWIAPAPRTIVASICPELAGFGAASTRIEHRRRGLVGEQLGAALQLGQQMIAQRRQPPCRAAYPVRQRRAIELDALARIDLRLPIERKVIGILADQHMRDQRLRRQPSLDDPRRRRRLDRRGLARAAAVTRVPGDEHAEGGGNDIEPFVDNRRTGLTATALPVSQPNEVVEKLTLAAVGAE